MASRRRKTRDHYLDLLANDPLFRGVSRPHVVVIGRLVEMLEIEPGAALACDGARETVIVAEGQALLADPVDAAVAAIGPGTAIVAGRYRIVAATPVRVFVVGRRELQTVATLAPRVAQSLADAGACSERNAVPRVAASQAR